MQSILPLYAIITITALGAKEIYSVERSASSACPKPGPDTLHASHTNDVTQILVNTIWDIQGSTIFCWSSQPVTWIFGSNSSKISSTERLDFKTIGPPPGFCLSLRITAWSSSWEASALYVKCKTNGTVKGTSRWYKIKGMKEFEPQGLTFNPAVTSDNVEPAETPYKGRMNWGEALNTICNSTNYTASCSDCIPATTVYAAAGGTSAFVTFLLILVVILFKKVKRQHKQIELTNDEIDEFMLGVAREKAQAKGINGLFVLPYDTSLEIPKSDVTFRSTVLGSGAFGQVIKGAYQGRDIAIKMVKNNVSNNADHLKSLLGELKVMSYLGSHPNLVGLIGAITRNIKGGEFYLIFEYCSYGNAHKFVASHRDDFVDMLAGQVAPEISRLRGFARFSMFYGAARQGVTLTTKELVRWSYEVALGMEYVAARNVYHGDLAARNILLTEDLTAKVGDFGLSKQVDMEKYNCYVQKKECPLPLKWMAIESLRDLTFSIRSDVWSFGVTMWELFTLGTIPYPGMDWNFESWKLLCEGKRLDKPEYASDSLYDIMRSCWNIDPKVRPEFAQLRESLHFELEKLQAL